MLRDKTKEKWLKRSDLDDIFNNQFENVQVLKRGKNGPTLSVMKARTKHSAKVHLLVSIINLNLARMYLLKNCKLALSPKKLAPPNPLNNCPTSLSTRLSQINIWFAIYSKYVAKFIHLSIFGLFSPNFLRREAITITLERESSH